MKQLSLIEPRPDPETFARGLAKCRAALAAAKERGK